MKLVSEGPSRGVVLIRFSVWCLTSTYYEKYQMVVFPVVMVAVKGEDKRGTPEVQTTDP